MARRATKGTLVSAVRAGLIEVGADIDTIFDQKAKSRLALTQNRARGDMHEQIARLAIWKSFGPITIEPGRRMGTPFGARVFDLFHPDDNVAFEVKSGRAYCTRFLRNQMRKDQFLKQSGLISGCIWMLFEGASDACLARLRKCDLAYVDMSGANEPFHPRISYLHE